MIQITKCVDYFNKTILTRLVDVAEARCWIAGGIVRDYNMGLPMNTDYDVFFPDEENFKKAFIWLLKQGATIKWESENGCKVEFEGRVYDLIKKYFADPKATIDAFDFTVSQFAVDTKNMYFADTSFIDLSKRQLMFNKITYPASTLKRVMRYTQKGFNICDGELRKLYEAINAAPKPEITDLKEDLTESEDFSSGVGFFLGID